MNDKKQLNEIHLDSKMAAQLAVRANKNLSKGTRNFLVACKFQSIPPRRGDTAGIECYKVADNYQIPWEKFVYPEI